MPNLEIERRFLLANDDWRTAAGASQRLEQGYLSVDKERTVRVRIVGAQAWLTLKGYVSDISRSEFEYPIPPADARHIMRTMCPFVLVKHRYRVPYEGSVYEIDEFFGDNAPLVVAELELPAEDAPFARPAWLGREITSDGRFTNAYLSRHPYGTWAAK
ncbi:CYTH domain-containing protein [Conchiformibius kuhniae]|uniref:CYTH domain-containing protein n=1 Tax=Conchiformibius kuhniae TaxID=211502 RepID=A0A8T9MWU3_9NEIS|nr:CYTH domain-containing protein [Conchiformibius kuhniae]UOP04672.1 CYTH domain-containing protein [Conchiformibius kuhniae]